MRYLSTKKSSNSAWNLYRYIRRLPINSFKMLSLNRPFFPYYLARKAKKTQIRTLPENVSGLHIHLGRLDLTLLGAVEEVHYRHDELSNARDGNSGRRAGRLVDPGSDQGSNDERQQEEDPPVPPSVLEHEQVGVDHEVHPRGRRHRGADLGHGERPGLHHLAAGREGQEGDDDQRHRPLQLDAVDVL